ncbi:transmembrane protein 82 isoform X1 [Conger conger]|uniref:transmembrane protein 82 isoform X1 n=1 Tax=Conger conger TaxID=82655 RepID=UPI002A5A4F51|nr:transmembrane protein 82 isoform X1 [Conger conger]
MVSFIGSWLSWILDCLTLETTPLNSFLQGLVGACGISVLCNLMRVHLFIKDISKGSEPNSKDRSLHTSGSKGGLGSWLQFWILTLILSLVGSRVASLVVLEFCLRAVSTRVTAGPESQSSSTRQFMVQCQFSLGCALSCSLHFLHEGAPQRLLSLLLAAGLSWLLASRSARLWSHVKALYPLHSSQRYCGVCITLLTSGRSLLPALTRALVLTFTVAAVTAVFTINHHFLSATEALRFWTPLTICYTLLVVYMQDEQSRHPGAQAVLQTVMVRLGGLMVLMLTVGRWGDVLHILVCFLGEAGCLIPTQDLLDAALRDVSEEIPRIPKGS